MSKQTTKTLVPKLRFPEFLDAGGWEEKQLVNLISTVTPPKKLLSESYLTEGLYPIIDQSKNYICGWTNDTKSVITCSLPLIVFGDHTCVLKFITEPFVQGADGIKILKTNELVEPDYLYQFLLFNPLIMESYKRHFSALKEKQIVFPNKKTGEQQKIADCLSSIDELITAHSQKHEALKAHKKGLMQQLFPATGETVPKLRFPEFRDDPEWGECLINELVRENILYAPKDGNHGNIHPKSSDYVDMGIPFIMANDFKNGEIDYLKCSHLSKHQADNLQKGFAKEGDVLLTHKGTVGEVTLIKKIDFPYLMLTPQQFPPHAEIHKIQAFKVHYK